MPSPTNAKRDANRVTTLLAVSNADSTTVIPLLADSVTQRLLVDASVTISSATVSGNKSNNAAVPGATNVGVLPGVATAAAPSYTEGFQVALSTDLAGALRVTGSLSVGGTTDNSAFTAGTSTGTPAMGFYHSTIDAVTDGRSAVLGMTAKRAMFVNLQTSAGAETGVAAVPLEVSLANTAANATAVKVNVASGGIASGAVASGAIASGALAAGSIAVGAIAAGATSIAENEDVASADGDRGVKVLIKRLDTPANSSTTDGDYEQPQMSAGRLWASAKIDTALPAGSNVIGHVIADTGSTTAVTGNVTVVQPTGTSLHAVLDTTSTTAVTQATGTNLHTVLDSGTLTTLTTLTGTTTLTPGTGATNLGKAEDAAHTSGDVGVFSLGVANEAQSTFGADADYAPQATDTKGNNLVVGNIAHDGVDAGNPIKIGAKAITTALPTAVAAADRANAISDKYGRQITIPVTLRDLVGTQTTTISASTAETTIVTAAASTFNDLVMLIVSNTSASTNTRIDFRDDTAGSILFSLQSNGGQPPIGFALPVPIPQTAVNKNWTAQCATSTTDIRIYAVFAKNA